MLRKRRVWKLRQLTLEDFGIFLVLKDLTLEEIGFYEETSSSDSSSGRSSARRNAAAESAVEILAQGTAGPYGFEVVRSDDPDALIDWLNEHRNFIVLFMTGDDTGATIRQFGFQQA